MSTVGPVLAGRPLDEAGAGQLTEEPGVDEVEFPVGSGALLHPDDREFLSEGEGATPAALE
jgi:hypothetical protein